MYVTQLECQGETPKLMRKIMSIDIFDAENLSLQKCSVRKRGRAAKISDD